MIDWKALLDLSGEKPSHFAEWLFGHYTVPYQGLRHAIKADMSPNRDQARWIAAFLGTEVDDVLVRPEELKYRLGQATMRLDTTDTILLVRGRKVYFLAKQGLGTHLIEGDQHYTLEELLKEIRRFENKVTE